MNILMGINAPWVGGTRIHALTLAEALINQGHRTLLVTDPNILETEMQSRNIPYENRVDDSNMVNRLAALVETEHPCCLHAHPAATILEFYQLSVRTKIPFIVTMHGEYLMYFTKDKIGANISNQVSQVIAVSQRIKDYLVAYSSLPAAKITVIPNGINTEEYHSGIDDASIRKQLKISPNEFVIMNFGRLESDRQEALLIMAKAIILLAKRGITVKGIFVGEGSMYDTLQQINQEFFEETGKDVLILPGFRRDLPNLLSIANVVIATGRCALEALAAEKPVLAFGRAGYAGLVSPDKWQELCETNFGDHGTLSAITPQALADELLLKTVDCNSFQTELRALVIRDYDANKVAKEIASIYESVTTIT